MNRIQAPGTLDGGDVLKVGDTVYVGRGGRTNAEGVAPAPGDPRARWARRWSPSGQKVLHLKSAVTALPDGSVIGYPPLVDDTAVFDRFLAGARGVRRPRRAARRRQLLMAADCPRSQPSCSRELGYEPVTVDISEFQKLEGCVTCLSVRLRHA